MAAPDDCFIARMLAWGFVHDVDNAIDTSAGDDAESDGGDGANMVLTFPDAKSWRNVYTNAMKVRVLDGLLNGISITAIAAFYSIKSRTAIYKWKENEAKIRAACAKKKSSKSTVGGQGRYTVFPYSDDLIQWIKQMRRDDFPLKTIHCVAFVKEEYQAWAAMYLATREEASLGRLVRRAAKRHGFSFRRPTKTVLSADELLDEQRQFASKEGPQVSAVYSRACIYNADETALYYYEDPGVILAERGRSKSAKVRGRQRSERASVLLTVSATGRKLRPLVIFRGECGGTVEAEMAGYSDLIVANVQSNGWMDATVWSEEFIDGVWADFVSSEMPEPLAIYVDNLKCHVSEASEKVFARWGTEVVALPKNTMAILQPLDVGVMGPFKKKLRAIALEFELTMVSERCGLPLRERLLALMKMPASEKRKMVVDRIVRAWDAADEHCIRRAWEKSGL